MPKPPCPRPRPGWPTLPATTEITTRARSTTVRRRMNLFATDNTSFLEPDVLERFSRAAVEHRCTSFVSTLCRQVAPRDPSRSAMRGRRQLCERVFRPRKLVFRLVEASLLEERAAEHDARVPDLVEHVVALADDLQGVQRLLLGALDVAGAQVDLRERRDGGRDLFVAAGLERHRDRMLEVLDRLLRLAEQELEAAEVVEQPRDVRAVGQLLVLRLRLLGVGAGEHPVPVALGEQRGLEVRRSERTRVVRRLGQL